MMPRLQQGNRRSGSFFKKKTLPQFTLCDLMSVRQYLISDPPFIKYSQFVKDTKGILCFLAATDGESLYQNLQNRTQGPPRYLLNYRLH